LSEMGYTAAVATRPVLRIFISSSAIDLRDYRDKVRDAVLSLNNLPVAMETFSARCGQPAIECRKMAPGVVLREVRGNSWLFGRLLEPYSVRPHPFGLYFSMCFTG
jgi:hypothetical protein